MKKRVVVDVDAGSDDAVAILLLLAFEQEQEFEILGITCGYGNTTIENVCKNVLRTVESIGRPDVPVFSGAAGPLISIKELNVILPYFHGKDGFGDIDFGPPKGCVQKENAVVALNRMAMENRSDGITLICLGPLTNIALALRTYPEFSKCLSEVYIMGGNIHGVGNSSSSAEFNFFKDPEAAQIVLSSLTCPVTILPWEPCIVPGITMKERLSEMNLSSLPHLQILNALDVKLYDSNKFWSPCDAFLAAAFLDKNIIKKSRKLHMTVELHGLYTRGQCVIDHVNSKPPNVEVIQEINFEVFKKLFCKMAAYRVP